MCSHSPGLQVAIAIRRTLVVDRFAYDVIAQRAREVTVVNEALHNAHGIICTPYYVYGRGGSESKFNVVRRNNSHAHQM